MEEPVRRWRRQGPWGGGGGGQGPWGGGNRPPDLEDILRKSQDRVKRMLPGGFGSGRSLAFIALIGVALWLATGFYRVEPDEQGVALVFGKVWKLTNPGLNYNLPEPMGEVFTPKVTRVNRVEIGFRSSGDSNGDQSLQDVPEESLMLTGDENIIDMQFVVLWQIKDPLKYLFAIRDPEETVKNVAESAMREIIGQTAFEYARTQGRGQIERHGARAACRQLLDDYSAGVLVTQVALQNVDPAGGDDRRLPRRPGGARRQGALGQRGAGLLQRGHAARRRRGAADHQGGERPTRSRPWPSPPATRSASSRSRPVPQGPRRSPSAASISRPWNRCCGT